MTWNGHVCSVLCSLRYLCLVVVWFATVGGRLGKRAGRCTGLLGFRWSVCVEGGIEEKRRAVVACRAAEVVVDWRRRVGRGCSGLCKKG